MKMNDVFKKIKEMNLNLSRQSKLIPVDKINEYTLKVFGVGSVGSHFVKTAVKTGFRNIEVYDLDIVEEENIAAQAFDFKHIGMNKVEAMKEICKESAGVEIITHHGRVSEENSITPEANTIYCCFFDSFEARQMLFDMLKDYPVIFIDGRIGMYNMRHYLVELDDAEQVKEYLKTLDTKVVSDLKCGEKACCPVNAQISSMIIINIINYLKNNDYIKVFIGNAKAPANNIYIQKIRDKKEEKDDN